MNKLTLQQKIEFCEWYLKLESWEFVCIAFYNFLRCKEIIPSKPVKEIDEGKFKLYFLDLYTLIMCVGKELNPKFQYGWAWPNEGDDREFRNTKITKLLKTLQL